MHPVLDHVNVAVLQCNDIKGMCKCCLASDVNEKEANVSLPLGKVLMLFLASYGCSYNLEKFHLFLFFLCPLLPTCNFSKKLTRIEFLLKKSKHREAGLKLRLKL